MLNIFFNREKNCVFFFTFFHEMFNAVGMWDAKRWKRPSRSHRKTCNAICKTTRLNTFCCVPSTICMSAVCAHHERCTFSFFALLFSERLDSIEMRNFGKHKFLLLMFVYIRSDCETIYALESKKLAWHFHHFVSSFRSRFFPHNFTFYFYQFLMQFELVKWWRFFSSFASSIAVILMQHRIVFRSRQIWRHQEVYCYYHF